MNKVNFLFFLTFSLYLALAILMGPFYDNHMYTKIDILDADQRNDLLFMNTLSDIDRHPFIFLLTPMLKGLSYIISNSSLALMLFQAFIAALNNIILFLILKKLNIRRSTAIFFTLIYAFSFSTLFFVSLPEIYVYSAGVNLWIIYLICSSFGENSTYLSKRVILPFLCVLGFGINPVNIALYIPALIYLFGGIYPRGKKLRLTLEFLILLVVYFLLCFGVGEKFYSLSKFLFPQNSLRDCQAWRWFTMDFSISRLIKVIQETLVAPLYALEIPPVPSNGTFWNCTFLVEQKFYYFIPLIMLVLFSIHKCIRSPIPKMIWVCIFIPIMHLILNVFYNWSWFLYSQNYLFFLVIVFAYFYSKTNKLIQNVILSFFLLFQIFRNAIVLGIFIKWFNSHMSYMTLTSILKLLVIDLAIVLSIILIGAIAKTKILFKSFYKRIIQNEVYNTKRTEG